MNKEQIKELIDKNFSIRKISIETNKSISTIRYWLKKFNLKTNNIASKDKYSNLSIIEKEKKLKTLNSEYVYKKRKEHRNKAIKNKGGKCEICGYNKCLSALEFHHIEPLNKIFEISINKMSKSWIKIEEEIIKCKLLCANCHREVHYNKKLEI